MSIKLPVYEVRHTPVEPEQATRLAADFLGAQNPKLTEREGRVVAVDGALTVELFRASGGIYAADAEHLRVVGDQPTELPSAERAFALAEELLDKYGLRPQLGSDDLELSRPRSGRHPGRHRDRRCRESVRPRCPGPLRADCPQPGDRG